MYYDLKATYWWYGMKRDIAEYVPFVTLVSKLKSSINDLLDCCSLCKCLSGSGKRLPWILSCVCRELSQDTIPFV
jgi:hypothetical protein